MQIAAVTMLLRSTCFPALGKESVTMATACDAVKNIREQLTDAVCNRSQTRAIQQTRNLLTTLTGLTANTSGLLFRRYAKLLYNIG